MPINYNQLVVVYLISVSVSFRTTGRTHLVCAAKPAQKYVSVHQGDTAAVRLSGISSAASVPAAAAWQYNLGRHAGAREGPGPVLATVCKRCPPKDLLWGNCEAET
jgi:hypothetical protein